MCLVHIIAAGNRVLLCKLPVSTVDIEILRLNGAITIIIHLPNGPVKQIIRICDIIAVAVNEKHPCKAG